MSTFHVLLTRSGVVEAESEDAVRAAFARDPWSESHLRIEAVDPWTIRLDARER